MCISSHFQAPNIHRSPLESEMFYWRAPNVTTLGAAAQKMVGSDEFLGLRINMIDRAFSGAPLPDLTLRQFFERGRKHEESVARFEAALIVENLRRLNLGADSSAALVRRLFLRIYYRLPSLTEVEEYATFGRSDRTQQEERVFRMLSSPEGILSRIAQYHVDFLREVALDTEKNHPVSNEKAASP